jgi:hypothetical protein
MKPPIRTARKKRGEAVMTKTTADLLERAETCVAAGGIRGGPCDMLTVIRELADVVRRGTEPVTDAEISKAIERILQANGTIFNQDFFFRDIRMVANESKRLAREVKELQARLSGTLGKNTVYPGEPHEELWVRIR